MYAIALFSGFRPSAQWLLLLPLLALQLLFNLGSALVAARATTSVRDISQLLPFVFRLLIYASGVLFNVDRYTSGKSYSWLFDLNPVYCLLTLARWTIMGGEFRADLLAVLVVWVDMTGL